MIPVYLDAGPAARCGGPGGYFRSGAAASRAGSARAGAGGAGAGRAVDGDGGGGGGDQHVAQLNVVVNLEGLRLERLELKRQRYYIELLVSHCSSMDQVVCVPVSPAIRAPVSIEPY